MVSKNKKKIVIIGAGVVGSSLAYCLSRRSHNSVTLLERDLPGSGASAHSFAWVNAFGKDPRDYHTLNRRSLDMWYRFEHQLNADIGIHYGGEMRWEVNSQRAEQLIQRIGQLQTWGYPCRLISREEVGTIEPNLETHDMKVASISDADIHVETDKFISVCIHRAKESGTTVYSNKKVTGFVLQNNKIAVVQTDDTEILCDVIVFASGVNTSELASLVGINIPQQISPGIVIKTTSCAKVFQNIAILHAPPTVDNHQHLHIRQLSDGSLRIGQGSQEGINRDESQEHADGLLEQTKKYLPTIADAKAIPTPIGYRPMPLDGFPILGFTKAIPNLYIALMHSGVTLAPLVGEMSSLEISDDVHVEWFSPYRLERFGL